MKLHENGEFKTEDELVRLYFVMDYAEKGDLYQYIHQSNGFGEDLGRYIFKKILEGIDFCHRCNISHLDIKPANILLDDKFNPIINDFGLSTGIKLKGETEPQKLYGQIGTREMKCPQMFEKDKAYYGVDADIFALGVLLFRIVVGDFPFVASNDVSYNDIKNKKYDDFWTRFINASLSKEFKDLFVLMVAYEPKERPKIKYILGKEPWMKKLIKEKPEEYEKLEKEYIAFMTNLEEKIKLLSSDGSLIKRPIIISSNGILIGFNEEEWKSFFIENKKME
jgi:5'-AMP-activated protein kinase catalytic alpha subunit